MASKRDLKKDIDYLVYEILSDCFIFSDLHPDHKTEEISAIISEAVELRNDLIARVNNPDGRNNPAVLKAFYKAVEKDLHNGVDALFVRLSAATSASK